MNEKIKQEAALAMKFISRLNVSGDAAEEPTQGDTQDKQAAEPKKAGEAK